MDGPYKVGTMREGQRKILISSSFVSVAHTMAIDILPDDALLQIFDFCRVGFNPIRLPFRPVLEWQRLIHVCRRWRLIIFSSPRRLDLYLLCEHGTPVRKNLDFWPAFPILIDYVNYSPRPDMISSDDDDNIIAALEYPDRVRRLKLPVTNSLLERVVTVAQEPFPILTQLWLSLEGGDVLVLPSEFLGGSAPRLREIHLEGIPFPMLPTLLSSASNLAYLSLHRIPHTGYISPEVMVASLATLTRLVFLSIVFLSSTSRPNQSSSRRQTAPHSTRVVLPVLMFLGFRGASEYLEYLVTQIDTPHLAFTMILYSNQLAFQVPQLFRFLSQTQITETACTMHAEVYMYPFSVHISLHSLPGEDTRNPLDLQIFSRALDWQVSHLVLLQYSAILSNVQHLSINAKNRVLSGQDDYIGQVEWLAFLRLFTAVETLSVCYPMARHVADALKDVTAEMAPEILPALCLLYLMDDPAGRVEEFINTRQLSGLPPITIASTQDEFLSRRSQVSIRKTGEKPTANVFASPASNPPPLT